MSTLTEIEQATKAFANARAVVSERVRRLNDEVDATKRRLLPGIKSAVIQARYERKQLADSLEESPELFVRPRTVIFHGVRVGYSKGKGKLIIEDKDKVVRLVKKHFPDQADVLIKTTETPARKALEALSVSDLKRLGVQVKEAGDRIMIKPTDSDIDKVVAALLDQQDDDLDDE